MSLQSASSALRMYRGACSASFPRRYLQFRGSSVVFSSCLKLVDENSAWISLQGRDILADYCLKLDRFIQYVVGKTKRPFIFLESIKLIGTC